MAADRELLITAQPDLIEAVARWRRHLSGERRLSPKTLEAYSRDAAQFLTFLTAHLGGAPKLADLKTLTTTDIRAFMAARRNDGAGSRTLARGIAGIRSLIRFLEKEGSANGAALRAIRPPRQKKTLPKALPMTAARNVIDVENSLDDEPWIAARNAAVLALCYGAGLRISEALGLRRSDAPNGANETLRIKGKGGKERMVPVLPAVSAAIETISTSAPTRRAPTPRSSSARAADRSTLASSSARWRRCEARSACPTRQRPMPCGIRLPRTCSPTAATSARSRNCLVTPACRRRRSIRRSTRSG